MNFLVTVACAATAFAIAPRVTHVHSAQAPCGTWRTDTVSAGRSLAESDCALAAASAAGTVDALTRAFADDVVLLYPGRPIAQGRGAATAVLAGLPSASAIRMMWHAVRGAVSRDGTRGYTSGYGRIGAAADSTFMRYIAYWNQRNGQWRVAALVIAPASAAGYAASECHGPDDETALLRARRGGATAADARRELLAADSAFSARSARDGASAAFLAFIAPDGATLGVNGVNCGALAVARTVAALGAGGLVWTPRLADVASSGDFGFTVGTATVNGTRDRSYTKYLTVWKRQRDGSWRFVADGGNDAPAL